MPLYIHTPIHAATKAHHHYVQTEKRVKSTQNEARTLLPMSGGGSATPATTVSTVTTAPTPGTLNPLGGGQTGQTVNQGNVRTLIPLDAGAGDSTGGQVGRPTVPNTDGVPQKPTKLQFVKELYFDAGAQDLIGTFTTLVVRAGVRYEPHEVHVYFRNETLDTRGTNLPFTSVVTGASVGVDYRFWFVKNHAFFTVSDGKYLSGANKDLNDFRVGFVGEFSWRHPGQYVTFSDIYTDLFYIDIVQDEFFTFRYRDGLVLHSTTDKRGYPQNQLLAYGVGAVMASGKGTVGTTDRVEAGFGAGYLFLENQVSLNVELRAGYAYRGEINRRAYLNPSIVLSGSFN